MEIGGAQLLRQKSKVDGNKPHINIANEDITEAEVAMAKAEKDSMKPKSFMRTDSAALEEVITELADLDGQLETLMMFVLELRKKVETARTAADNSKEDLDSLKVESDARDQEIEAFRKKEVYFILSLHFHGRCDITL